MLDHEWGMVLTRREFGLLTLSGLAFPASSFAQTVAGVRLGVHTRSFRELTRSPNGDLSDAIVKAMTECGLTECELFAPHIEPAPPASPQTPEAMRTARDDLRRWRIETPLDYFAGIRRKFEAARLTIHAFNYDFAADFLDSEIDRGFDMAKALGAQLVTASTSMPVARRVAPFAEQHKATVALHNPVRTQDPNDVASPQALAAAIAMSKRFKVSLDIAHFVAAGIDPVAYLREQHDAISCLRLKDTKRNQEAYTPWGEGDTPIREVLQLLKRERWPIHAYVDYEHTGPAGPVAEVQRCVAFVRQALV
jgi:sugar phosphate isomerase/epimerase